MPRPSRSRCTPETSGRSPSGRAPYRSSICGSPVTETGTERSQPCTTACARPRIGSLCWGGSSEEGWGPRSANPAALAHAVSPACSGRGWPKPKCCSLPSNTGACGAHPTLKCVPVPGVWGKVVGKPVSSERRGQDGVGAQRSVGEASELAHHKAFETLDEESLDLP